MPTKHNCINLWFLKRGEGFFMAVIFKMTHGDLNIVIKHKLSNYRNDLYPSTW